MNFIDLFCGAGGFSIGLTKKGHKLLKGFDNWNSAGESFSSYFGKKYFSEVDLSVISSEFIYEQIDNKNVKIDLVVGGPPCQGFSSMGNQNIKDPRNQLVLAFANIISEIKPKYFILENVHGIKGEKFESTIKKLYKLFNDFGYKNICSGILDAQDFGVPQRRKRFFMIGSLDNNIDLTLPSPKVNQKTTTVGDVIMDLVGMENNFPNHIPINHNEIVKARYAFIKEGGKLDIKALPKKLAYGSRSDFKDNKIKNFKIFAIDLFEQENQYIVRNGKKIWQQDHSLKLPSLLNSKKIINYMGFSKNVEFIKGDFSLIKKINDKLDFSYIDIAHDYQSTKDAIDLCINVGSSDMLIFGDDYGDGYTVDTEWGVKKAVQDSFCQFSLHYNWIWESERKFYINK